MRTALALASLVLLLVACGDNLVPGTSDTDAADPDAAIATDGRVDAMLDANCPLRAQGQVGGPCTTNTQCDSSVNAGDGFCSDALDGGIGWPAIGYCLTFGCTMDSQCGAGNVCVTVTDSVLGPFNACMPACGTGECACSNGQVCSNNLATSPMNKMACIPGNPSAIDGDACSGFAECDINSICRLDMAEHPGGQCIQIGCTIGMDTTCTSGGDGHCAAPGFVSAGNGCLDACVSDANCRTAEGYRCYDAGGATGKHCRHPQTGDACAVDTDCGDANIWDCMVSSAFPGGYCSLQAACNPTNGSGCSAGSSVCYDPPAPNPNDAYCIDRCTGSGQGTCRTGYDCMPMGGTPPVSGCL